MKRMIYVILLLSGKMLAQQPDAVQIMEKSRELTLMGSLEATVTLAITEKNGSVRNRTISMITRSYPDGTEKRIIKFQEPADVRGTGMLIIDNKNSADEMWIYLPALKKTRRIATSEKGKSFMNSEFSNSDMSSPALSDFNIRHLDGSGSGENWIIESVPAGDDKISEYGFSRKISHISKTGYQIRKMEFYDRENKLFKKIEVLSVHPGENSRYIISGMKAENLANGRSSVIKFTNISMNSRVDESVFSLQNLERQ